LVKEGVYSDHESRESRSHPPHTNRSALKPLNDHGSAHGGGGLRRRGQASGGRHGGQCDKTGPPQRVWGNSGGDSRRCYTQGRPILTQCIFSWCSIVTPWSLLVPPRKVFTSDTRPHTLHSLSPAGSDMYYITFDTILGNPSQNKFVPNKEIFTQNKFVPPSSISST
jgi:hypothetical protein